MSLIDYKNDKYGRVYDPQKEVKKHWGIDFEYYSELNGLKLVDRKKPKHTVEIELCKHAEFSCAMVYWKNGGYNCLDHAIEQFKPIEVPNEQ